MDVVTRPLEYTQEVSPDVLEAYFKSQGPIVLPSQQPLVEQSTASANLLQVEGDRVIFNPQGPDPLGIRGYELELPPEEEAHKLGFAFGGQPVIFDDDPSAALPIIGFSVPNGGPSYNVLEDMGFDVQKLSQGVIAPRLPPHLRENAGGVAEKPVAGAVGGGRELQTVEELLQKASRRIASRRKTDPSDGLSGTLNRRNAHENKFVQTGSSLRYKSPTIGRNTTLDHPNDGRWNYPLNAYRVATYEEELQRKGREYQPAHRPERPGLCGGDLTKYSHLAASALQQTQGWLSAMMPQSSPVKNKEESAARRSEKKKTRKRKVNGENGKVEKLTPQQQAALAHATISHQFSEAQKLAGEQRVGTGEQRVGTGEQRLGIGDQRLATVDQRLATVDQRLATVEQRLGGGEQRVGVQQFLRSQNVREVSEESSPCRQAVELQSQNQVGGVKKSSSRGEEDDTIYKITTLRGSNAVHERSPRRGEAGSAAVPLGTAGVTLHSAGGLALPGTATSIPLDFSALPELLRKACEEPNSISLREPLVKHDPSMPMTAIPTLLERPRVFHPGITAEQIEQAKLEAIAEGRVKPGPAYASPMSAADQVVFASHAKDAETAARTQLAAHAATAASPNITEQATLFKHEQAKKWAADENAQTDSPPEPHDASGAAPAGTELRGTELRGTELRGTELRGTELRGTSHLEAGYHQIALPDHLEPTAAAEVPKGPLPSKIFKIASAVGQREVEMVPLCDNPRIELIREFLSQDECDKIQNIIEKVEAFPHSPNNLFVNEDLSEDNRHFLERIAKRMAGITRIPFEDFVAICPSVVNLTAMDATKDFSNIVRIYLDPRSEGCESDFPYLGVSVCPHKGAAIRWQTKNERGFKLTRSTHSEIIGETNTSRRFLTAYIR